MNVELATYDGDNYAVLTDAELPAKVKRIEYYRDQKLFLFVYEDPDHEGDLVHYELHPDIAEKIKKTAEVGVAVFTDGVDEAKEWYKVPLIQIGV